MEEFATNLIVLWDEYRSSSSRVFQPTMTDFVEYVREKYASQGTDSSVNEGANKPYMPSQVSQVSDPARWATDEPDKGSFSDEDKRAQYMRGGVRPMVRRLRGEGTSLARIRARVRMDFGEDLTIAQITAMIDN